MQDIVFRKIMAEDNDRLATVIREGMTAFGLNGPGSGFHDPQLDDLFSAYQAPGHVFLVAERRGLVLGGGGIAPLRMGETTTCELQRMYLAPQARGLGIGKGLLQRCLQAARHAGYAHCYLETQTAMAAAQALYRRFGFQRQKTRTGNTGHCACNTFYMMALVD